MKRFFFSPEISSLNFFANISKRENEVKKKNEIYGSSRLNLNLRSRLLRGEKVKMLIGTMGVRGISITSFRRVYNIY